jgi:HPt (histidine-containing phosphotransfer) domain-containing protein
MNAIEIQDQAHRLYEARGATSIAEAAQRAARLEQQGNKSEAATWRRIEAALRMMHGPRMS